MPEQQHAMPCETRTQAEFDHYHRMQLSRTLREERAARMASTGLPSSPASRAPTAPILGQHPDPPPSSVDSSSRELSNLPHDSLTPPVVAQPGTAVLLHEAIEEQIGGVSLVAPPPLNSTRRECGDGSS